MKKLKLGDIVYGHCTTAIFETVHKHVRAAANNEKTIGQFLAGKVISELMINLQGPVRRVINTIIYR